MRGLSTNITFEFIFYHLNLLFHDKEQVLAFLRWHLFRYLKGAIWFLCLLFAVLSISALSDSLRRAQFLIPGYPHWLSVKSIDLIRKIRTETKDLSFFKSFKNTLKVTNCLVFHYSIMTVVVVIFTVHLIQPYCVY